MSLPEPPLTLGVEEEYQIIEPETRNLYSYISEFLAQDEQRQTSLEIKPELMQSQVEVGSHVCQNIQEVRQEVARSTAARRVGVGGGEPSREAVEQEHEHDAQPEARRDRQHQDGPIDPLSP